MLNEKVLVFAGPATDAWAPKEKRPVLGIDVEGAAPNENRELLLVVAGATSVAEVTGVVVV